jgi:hypothetical protein
MWLRLPLAQKERDVQKSRGLGDTVDKFTTATGIKAIVKKAAKGDCGCEKRRNKLNDLFPYKK